MNELSHVYWIGGGPTAGKTTVSNLIAASRNVEVFHTDDAIIRGVFFALADPDRHPRTVEFRSHVQAKGMKAVLDEFASLPIDDSVRGIRDFAPEVIDLTREALKSRPSHRPIIVESAHVYPEFMGEVVDRDQVCYLVASDETILSHYHKRVEAAQRSENYERSIVARGQYLRETVIEHGFKVLMIDEFRSPDAVAERVIEHFGL